MEKYLVGGCVRDELLGREIKDRDWVVVGASPEEMLTAGFKSVGKDFPVFLHPESKEEYALARTERKTAPGYTGFSFHAAPDVSLKDDLARRDLTINAIAKDEQGNYIDPYHGRQDLENRILRHVSPAFAEDPVRILRIARFAARYAELGFTIADETLSLMKNMVASGEVDALVAERVWQETERALGESSPDVFFQVLRNCGALARIFPEIDNLFGIPQVKAYHPEVDTGVHIMMVMQQAARLSKDTRVRFAALTHDLGKAVTPKDELPQHIGHEEAGVPLVKALCDRLRVPREFRDLAVHVAQYHLYYHRAKELNAGTILKLIKNLDGFRRPERFDMFLLACEADSRGRPGYEDRVTVKPQLLKDALQAAAEVDVGPIIERGLKGDAISMELDQQRIQAIKQSLAKYAE
ncbi:MAG: multifunctional CCA addition/repair protein [Thioalkalispiraceae bacterium]|jgi:tRNA nucleotidyltransferase (CCA-adding enzyme)